MARMAKLRRGFLAPKMAKVVLGHHNAHSSPRRSFVEELQSREQRVYTVVETTAEDLISAKATTQCV